MRIRIVYIAIVLFLFAFQAKAQDPVRNLGFWYFKNLSGEFSLTSGYRTLNSRLNELTESEESGLILGGLKLNSSSYLWTQDIIAFNLGAEYNPAFREDKYLTIPDRSEVRNLYKVNLQTSVFNNKAVSLNAYYNLNNSYFNRENLTNVKSWNNQKGVSLSINNRILPLIFSFTDMSWEQTETDTDRTFTTTQTSFEGRTTKSFYGNDRHELRYTLREYNHRYAELSSIENKVSRIEYQGQAFFDENRKYSMNANIRYHDQNGTFTYSRFENTERIMLHLPLNFTLQSNYSYYGMTDPEQKININRTRSALKHQLFESLTTNAYVNYTGTSHSYYDESSFITGLQATYTKKFALGRFNLGYHWYRHSNKVEGESRNINILREELVLNDLEENFLEKAFVENGSVVVTDITSTIIYQEGLDFIINTRNSFTEIVRVPGGQIANNQLVLVNYVAIQPGSYDFVSSNNTLTSSILLFNRILELYFRGTSQNYLDINRTEYLTLNSFYQNVTGIRLFYKFATAGLEYDYYNADLIPYKRISYYLNLNFKLKSRVLLSFNGNLKDYTLLDTGSKQVYTNLSTRLAYSINSWLRLNIEGGYLHQNGRTIDLTLVTGKSELIASIRRLTVKGSFNVYKRTYSNSNFFYTGTHIDIIRKF